MSQFSDKKLLHANVYNFKWKYQKIFLQTKEKNPTAMYFTSSMLFALQISNVSDLQSVLHA